MNIPSSILLITIFIGFVMCKPASQSKIDNQEKVSSDQNADSVMYVFSTNNLQRYEFPTHINDLVIDRALSSVSEVFMVIVETGKSVHHHQHNDTEQIFYIIEGTGILSIGPEKVEYSVKPGDVVRIPLSTLHSIRTDTNFPIKYLCVDCFAGTPLEPTWDEHVKVVCEQKGWDYHDVVK